MGQKAAKGAKMGHLTLETDFFGSFQDFSDYKFSEKIIQNDELKQVKTSYTLAITCQ